VNQVCNFTEMLTHHVFDPHLPCSCWEHQATVRPEAPFLSWTDAGSTLSFVDVKRLARGLKHLGVAKWDGAVMLLARFALANFGAVEVAVGETNKVCYLEHKLKLGRPRLINALQDLAVRPPCEHPEILLNPPQSEHNVDSGRLRNLLQAGRGIGPISAARLNQKTSRLVPKATVGEEKPGHDETL
jgi:hypothetical protein